MDRIPEFLELPTDGVVTLRPWRESDIPAMTAACRDPEIPRWTMVPLNYTEDDARAFISGLESSREAATSTANAIVDATTGEVLGSVGLVRFTWPHNRAEIGYWVTPAARGRGVAVRGTKLLTDWAFANLPLARIDIYAAAGNGASQRVAEKAGYTREGVLTAYLASKAGQLDAVIFGRVNPDFTQ